MGAAPSAELAHAAPFLVPQGGARQVALIPIVKHYFPTSDCPLFKQLYEAYTDPSVRYYMRPNFDGKSGDLSRIPPIEHSREDLHRLLLRHTEHGMFPTNAAIREAYEAGDVHRIRPVLCAVVFLYEGTNCAPEGSVQLPSPNRGGASTFVKVIGIIGDTCTLANKADDGLAPFGCSDVLKIRTLIMKSAGDHNMSRVVLLAAYIYYHQCCDIIGLPNVPALGASFTCFKTNIPFLCFLREMRDRMSCVLEAPKNSKFYIDDYCLHGAVSHEYVAKMMPAFACYYIFFLNAKAEQRAMKLQTHQQQPIMGGAGKECAGLTMKTLMNRTEARISSTYGEAANNQALMAIRAAAVEGALKDGSNTGPKITYVVKGYVTRAVTSISNWTHAVNEVYVVCVDGTVNVVDRTSVEASDGPTHTPSLVHQANPSEDAEAAHGKASAVVETIQVRRGDILSFYVPSSTHSSGANASLSGAAAPGVSDDDDIYDVTNLDALRFCSTSVSALSLSSSEAPVCPNSPSFAGGSVKGTCEDANASTIATSSAGLTGVDGSAAPFEPKKGSWRVDDSIFIENVLLSLVRDECKLAREATEQDPGWVYDDVNRCLVHDGSFYVWHFRRGHEDFYYGTVPKFANLNRQPNRKSGGGSGGYVEQGKAHLASAGAVKDTNNGACISAAQEKSGATSPLPPLSRATNTAKEPVGALSTNLPLAQRQSVLTQQPSLLQHPQQAAFLPPALAAASSDVQLAYLASIAAGAALPPPPTYDASTLSAVQGTSVPFIGSTGEGYLNNPVHAAYSAEAAAMASAGAPMMYAFLPPAQSQNQVFLAQQQQYLPLQHLPAFPSQGMYSSGTAPSPSPPPQQHAMWGMLGTGSGQTTAAPSQSLGPYMVNAQGQLVPMENVMGGGVAPPPQVPYTQPVTAAAPQSYPSYVMVNGQLCILQPAPPSGSASATAIAPSSPQCYQQYPHAMTFNQ
ncbi:hypothetical protein LSCM4_03242 [Leishmania orientalis]|uniref:Uncharacterized protein n=1 Tax=Leishmania orientalis TaxID=2249476 RepID=A0A836GTQ5_9TRYP|nr:hypothetical protein LSCM4_03242 [Leishmania orientalis]